jgi:hypothetical protein
VITSCCARGRARSGPGGRPPKTWRTATKDLADSHQRPGGQPPKPKQSGIKWQMDKNSQNVYSYNNVTAKKNADGSIMIDFDGGPKQ